mmetsp:Transcript_6194/g.11725  ORF Transcript_6194/g.11725 Transcript_6194/m.11725 type:complete len:211 (+) Transcript_6194:1087-1719(+)
MALNPSLLAVECSTCFTTTAAAHTTFAQTPKTEVHARTTFGTLGGQLPTRRLHMPISSTKRFFLPREMVLFASTFLSTKHQVCVKKRERAASIPTDSSARTLMAAILDGVTQTTREVASIQGKTARTGFTVSMSQTQTRQKFATISLTWLRSTHFESKSCRRRVKFCSPVGEEVARLCAWKLFPTTILALAGLQMVLGRYPWTTVLLFRS